MHAIKCFSQNLINNSAQTHVVTCAISVLKVRTALQNNLHLMCLQQNGQGRTHRTHVMCTEGRDWKPERTLMTNTSSSLSPLPCNVRQLASVQFISATKANLILGNQMVTARSKLPLLASTFWSADSWRTCRHNQWHWKNAPSTNC